MDHALRVTKGRGGKRKVPIRAATASCGLVLATATTDETAGVPPLRRPKKRGPFQAVPVIARAITERLSRSAGAMTTMILDFKIQIFFSAAAR